MTKAIIISQRDIKHDYDTVGTEYIINHPKHGLILLTTGFGGIDTPSGGAVRFRHGMVISLRLGDNFDSFNRLWNDTTSNYLAMTQGYDDARSVLNWSSAMIENLAKSLDL